MKPGGTFKALPFAARCAIVQFGFAGVVALAWAIRHETGAILSIRLIVLLLFATVTARLKVQLYRGATISFLTAIVLMAVIRDGAAVSIITAVWGVGFLVEAALRVVIVYNTSPGTALAISNVTPFVWAGAFCAWTVAYGTHQKRKNERLAAEAAETGPRETV